MADSKSVNEEISTFLDSINQYWQECHIKIVDVFVNIVLAVICFFIARWILKKVNKMAVKSFKKARVDETVISFSKHAINFFGNIIIIIISLNILGIPTATIITALGALALAIGLALQGSLSNLASSITIIMFKPFKVGDLVSINGEIGHIKEIELLTTNITTLDNKNVIIPNASITSNKIINYTATDTLRVDLSYGVAYKSDIDQVKQIIEDVIKSNDKVLKDPEHFIALSEHADSSINFVVRVWTKAEDYWAVYFYMQENIKKEFDKNSIEIPFPQRDIHIISDCNKK